MAVYSELAPFYDLLFPPSEEQAAFLIQKLSDSDCHHLLDAGCGTGRHLEILAEQEFAVTGLEPEAAMALRANERLGDRGRVHTLGLEHSAELEEAPFDAVLCLGNTLAHLLDHPSLKTGLEALSGALRPDGLLLLQMVHFEKVLREKKNPFEPRDIVDSAGRELRFHRAYAFGEDLLEFHLLLEGENLKIEDRFPLRPWRLAELEPTMREVHLEIEGVYGNWKGDDRTKDSPATIISARKIRS
ncbi:MAG: class I SAM-dependent methyltransferase [Candidatus Krumholzibacteria bacterium]|jgi:SAM-dependent methyltransferase|nr:class I SAM-dependent methyltransferase [Candidatus Krumholzibacteria bacterium]MDP7021545.1 class I SAM-dependent methyltransferase [Candidatus Krumholzibacteria bacterium]